MFFGLFFTFSFFFFFEVLVFTHLMCACTCCRDPKQIFVSLPISLARGLKKYILSCFFFFLTSFKVETGEDTQLPTRVSFLTRSLFVVCSNVFYFFSLEWDLSLWMYWERKKPDTLKTKQKKEMENVCELKHSQAHCIDSISWNMFLQTEQSQYFPVFIKKKKSLSKHGGRSFFFMALLNRFNLFWQWETRRGVSWRIFMRTWFFFLAGVECVWTTFMKKKKKCVLCLNKTSMETSTDLQRDPNFTCQL